MIVVLCVCKSGGEYNAEWVKKLRRGVARNLTAPYEFRCLTDIDTPYDIPGRIPLKHKWPGWWSKIEMFREITGPTLYLDLDTVVTGSLDHLAKLDMDFAMLRNFHIPEFVGSGVMWFGKSQRHVYDRFCEKPFKWIEYHDRKTDGPYLGDQAFIWESMKRQVKHLPMETIKSYKFHCKNGLPENTSLVCFHGLPKLPTVKADWIERHW
jgi:hypothetical protein